MVHITIAQLRRPGCPVGMGANAGILDMSTALLTMGSPENSLGITAQAEVARSFGLPSWGLAGATDAKCLDAQSGLESAFAILAQGLGGVNLIHDVGYMAAGMACSCEQLILGDEIVGMAKRFVEGVTVDSETLAREVIEAVGPGGHFLSQKHTHRHFRNELWMTKMLNRQPIDAWRDAGSPAIETRVREKFRRIMETHRAEALDAGVCDELERLRVEGEKEILAQAEKG
jgi:trimethylamine--corrinoid protein Co-methyltransferase